VKKGERASPGELKGDFDLTRDSGTLYANTECGIFGKLSAEDAAKIVGAALPIAKKDEIKTGRAAILATVSGNETREYDIEIEKIYSPSGSTRNLLLHVTDEELLAQTGGVVQGMSGSAILQDGKIIGAVTHVLLDDPSRGYGIFIENMLSAAGLSSE
jgi:stage IV sporulation protein B